MSGAANAVDHALDALHEALQVVWLDSDQGAKFVKLEKFDTIYRRTAVGCNITEGDAAGAGRAHAMPPARRFVRAAAAAGGAGRTVTSGQRHAYIGHFIRNSSKPPCAQRTHVLRANAVGSLIPLLARSTSHFHS